MYRDAANRKIMEPIDYLIEASRKSRKLCIALNLSENEDLLREAEQLNARITAVLADKPIEEWETASRKNYRDVVDSEIAAPIGTRSGST